MGTIVDSPLILESQRLILRRQQASDFTDLVDLWADPEVTRYLGGPRDRDWLRGVFQQTAEAPLTERYDLWPVVEKETGEVVGHCGLLEKDVEGKSEIELTYVFARSAWGKGYATEIGRALKDHAFGELGLERLIALIEPGNVASERVAHKIGMRFDREVIRPGGALREVYVVEAKDARAATPDCFVCRKHRGEVSVLGGAIYKDRLVYLSHASLWGDETEHYLGHLFVEPKRHAPELADLTEEEAQAVGLYTSRLARALMHTEGMEHVYAFVIGDGVPHVHVHVIGRYPGAPRAYWGPKVDEWPEAPRGGEAEIAGMAARVRAFLREHYG